MNQQVKQLIAGYQNHINANQFIVEKLRKFFTIGIGDSSITLYFNKDNHCLESLHIHRSATRRLLPQNVLTFRWERNCC